MSKTSWQVKQRYNDKAYDKIYITVPKGQKEIIQSHAKNNGESTNAFINRAIKETLEKEKNKL